MAIYSRSDWSAANAKYRNSVSVSKGLFIHHSAGPITQTPKQIQDYHMQTKGWSDIAYSWLVDHKGNIYEGRGWGIAGGHTKGFNSTSHAICYIGNTETADATEAAKQSINLLIAEYESKYGKGFILPHLEAAGAATACPGKGLFEWIKAGRPTKVDPKLEIVPVNESEVSVLVEGFYKSVLHRPSDQGGKQWWINKAVDENMNREDLFFAFLAQAGEEADDMQKDLAILKQEVAALKAAPYGGSISVNAGTVDIDAVVDEIISRLQD